MSQFDGSEDCWSEDYRRERRVGTVAQAVRAAINASANGNAEVVAECIADAQHHWRGDDAIARHIACASEIVGEGLECRRHLREAAQLLDARGDWEIRFSVGGDAR